MKMLAAAFAALTTCFAAMPAVAQQKDACYDRQEGSHPANTFYNAQFTDTWRWLLQSADAGIMAQLAGVYQADLPSPDGVYLSRQIRSFEPSGLFQYQDQTCGNIAEIPCSQNQGTGEWRAATWSDGSIYVMIRFSDLIRTSACAGARYQIEGAGLRDEFGTVWQRLQ